MKVLYIVGAYEDSDGSAAQPFVKSQIDSVRDAGHDVEILNVRGGESRLNYLKAILKVRRLVKINNYDIVHGHYTYCGLVAACQRTAVSVVSFMGSDLQGTPREDGRLSLQGRIDVWLSRLAQLVVKRKIVKSRRMYDSLVRCRDTLILPNGVDFNIFRPMDRDEARRKLGLDSKKRYVLFAGSYMNKNKCYPVVEDAVKIVSSECRDVELLLAHGRDYSDMPLFMNAADVLALPSMKEGSPNVVKEAMACNLPVVATDVGDVREVIANVDGCSVSARTPEDFARHISVVLERCERTKGREAIKHLAINEISGRLIEFYEKGSVC